MFTYDSLGRQLRATNPESGTVSYAYDNAGNLLTRTDARGVVTSYACDALNRVTQVSYSDRLTPAVNYSYDTGPNGKGHLTSVVNGNSTTSYTAFDPVGLLNSNQLTAAQKYLFNYSYNLAGSLVSETYPSGRTMKTGYDGANRPLSLSEQIGSTARSYVAAQTYAPHGAMASQAYGNVRQRFRTVHQSGPPQCWSGSLQPANVEWVQPNHAAGPIGHHEEVTGLAPTLDLDFAADAEDIIRSRQAWDSPARD